MTEIAQIAPLPKQPRRNYKLKLKSNPKHKRNKRAEARRRGRERQLAERRKLFLNLKNLPDDACLTISEWGALNSLPPRSARRILSLGPPDGPVVTKLSQKRWAVTIRHNREWQDRRARS